jgi:hypothetical protein
MSTNLCNFLAQDGLHMLVDWRRELELTHATTPPQSHRIWLLIGERVGMLTDSVAPQQLPWRRGCGPDVGPLPAAIPFLQVVPTAWFLDTFSKKNQFILLLENWDLEVQYHIQRNWLAGSFGFVFLRFLFLLAASRKFPMCNWWQRIQY